MEQGSHAQLIGDPQGSYASLYRLQQAAPAKEKPSFEELQAEKHAIEDAAAGGLIPQPSVEKQVDNLMYHS